MTNIPTIESPRQLNPRPEHNPNPAAADILTATLDWAHTNGLGDFYPEEELVKRAKLSAALGSLVGPELSADGLERVTKQIAYLYIFDDLADGSHQAPPNFLEILGDTVQSVAEGLENAQTSTNPFVKALGSIALGIKNPNQRRRWTYALTDYHLCVDQETILRENSETPTLKDFMRMRRPASGVPTVLSLVEPTTGISIPEADWQDSSSTVNRLTTLITDVVALDNDLLSLRKELEEEAAQLNAITVIQHEYSCTLEEAVGVATALRDAAAKRIADIKEELLKTSPNNPLLGYIQAGEDWINGHLKLAAKDERYSQQATKKTTD